MIDRPLVKLISIVANAFALSAAVRNVVAPGAPLFFIPNDETFQSHFHGGADEKMAFVFQLFGCCLATASVVKLVVVFCHEEGTFLRQKLFVAIGIMDLVFAAVVVKYEGLALAITGGFAAMQAAEGVAFLVDAMKPRAVKKARPVTRASSKKKSM